MAAIGAVAVWRVRNRNELGHLAATRTGDLTYAGVPRGAFDARWRETCGASEVTAAGAGARGFARQPYLQQVTAASAQVVWTQPAGPRCEVRLRRAVGGAWMGVRSGVDDTASLPDAVQLIAQLDGLAASTDYCYAIDCDGAAWLTSSGFRTAPELGTAGEPVRFVAFGDVGQGTSDQRAVRAQLETVEADFALITGDLAYEDGTLAQLERYFFAVYRRLMRQVAFFPAAGNHEYDTAEAWPYLQAFSLPDNAPPPGRERWYSFDWGAVHVVVLDTERLVDAQVAWLDADLAAAAATPTAAWTIAVAHRPPYASGHHGGHAATRARLAPVFERHAVPLVLLGHEHHYERTVPIRGVTYVVTGGGGRGTRRVGRSDWTAFSARVAHFVHVTIEGDTLTLRAIDATGAEFDTLRLTRAASRLPDPRVGE
jgi:hypothetical protein